MSICAIFDQDHYRIKSNDRYRLTFMRQILLVLRAFCILQYLKIYTFYIFKNLLGFSSNYTSCSIPCTFIQEKLIRDSVCFFSFSNTKRVSLIENILTYYELNIHKKKGKEMFFDQVIHYLSASDFTHVMDERDY